LFFLGGAAALSSARRTFVRWFLFARPAVIPVPVGQSFWNLE
jgi:hypothetical protein